MPNALEMSYPVVVVEEIFVLVLIFFWCPVYIALIVRVTYMDTPLMMLKHDDVELLIYESHGNIILEQKYISISP